MISRTSLYWFGTAIYINIANCGGWIADFISIFTAIERSVACLLPLKFHLINRWEVVFAVIAVSIVVNIGFYLPQCFAFGVKLDPATGYYIRIQTKFGAHPAYGYFMTFLDGFSVFMAVCITAVSTVAIIGMFRAQLRRQVFCH